MSGEQPSMPTSMSDDERKCKHLAIQEAAQTMADTIGARFVWTITFFEDKETGGLHMMDGGTIPMDPLEVYSRLAEVMHEMRSRKNEDGETLQ